MKDYLKQSAAQWMNEKHATITAGDKLLNPKRSDVFESLSEIWLQFLPEIAKMDLRVMETIAKKELITAAKRNSILMLSNQ